MAPISRSYVRDPALPWDLFQGGALVNPLKGLQFAPTGLLRGPAAQQARAVRRARALAGRDDVAFSAVTLFLRPDDQGPWHVHGCDLPTLALWAEAHGPTMQAIVAAGLNRLTAPRAPFAGLSLDRPRIMGIVNCTPDSFSDGGDYASAEAAVARGLAMLEAGADVLDIGGESTRPGSDTVEVDEEIRRIVPVVKGLAERGALISIDTRRAAVMEAALAHGARIINDITALAGDPDSLGVAVRAGVPVILMHMQGEPRTMQANPTYGRAPADVYAWLARRVTICVSAGMPVGRICVDPGIGFGKTLDHNLDLLAHIGLFHGLGCAVLVGASRKSLIARASGAVDGEGRPTDRAKDRMPGSLAIALGAAEQAIQFMRVHDVEETVQAVRVAEGIRRFQAGA
ncbi:dihydropteroate synthase [Roseospira marina]|uniref:dihydropteroate synthase n=1 Tax=Roseospira marina TaxID=140057 RepID=UPI001854251A|nr:dihydropteroate synthase [Roseospira marina]MBB5087112.1 dihydropteroate synthase [Roseospira marina]